VELGGIHPPSVTYGLEAYFGLITPNDYARLAPETLREPERHVHAPDSVEVCATVQKPPEAGGVTPSRSQKSWVEALIRLQP
jgi:hypothetical protein